MRRTRLLILASILLIVGSVGITYKVQKGLQQRQAPHTPARLPEGITAQANDWTWTHAVGNFTKVQVKAKDLQQIAEPSKFELRGVELRIFSDKKKDTFDLIKSAKADFDTLSGVLFSDGEVEITMGLPTNPAQPPPDRLLRIKSAGVTFDSKAGKVATDRAASFEFGLGSGQATGADYDSVNRELKLHNDVLLNWGDAKPDKKMTVTAGNLLYKEVESKIFLAPTAKLVRGTFTLEGTDSVVTVAKGAIQLVEAQKAHGEDKQPNRALEYAADQLRVNFAPSGEVQNIAGEQNARLVQTTATGQTTVTTNRIDLAFDASGSSTLTKADANGSTVVESKPQARAGARAPDTRILRSESVLLSMRPGGEEIDKVETHTPGTVEFIPNQPGERKRTLNGERLWITYGDGNQIRTFRAVTVSTRTEREPPKGKPAPPPALTWSKDLQAEFDPKTGQLAKLEQWTDFRYEEGDRRAHSASAVLNSPTDEITLNGKARFWDASGSTDAEKIVINQKTDAFEATGNVSSTRLPDQKEQKDPKKQQSGSPMLAGSDPIEARAARMTSVDRNQQIRYENNAVVWQGPNRITADIIDIDRKNQVLTATGNVVSQFVDKHDADDKKKKPATSVFTTIRAPKLTYTDKERVALYSGGAVLNRPGVVVNGKEIRIWLTPAAPGKDSTLDRAFADGQVKIVQTAPDRTRTGTGEHGEYYLADERMVLNGGSPQLVDTIKGTTRGQELTWFARNDRLLVESAESQPAITSLRKK